MIVVDASVVYKWIIHEEPLAVAEQARSLLYRLLTDEEKILAPNILLYEISNIFAYKTSLSAEDVKEAWQQFSRLPITIADTDREFIAECLDFAKNYKVSVYDASYAILAEKKQCDLFTADEKFVHKVDLVFVKSLHKA